MNSICKYLGITALGLVPLGTLQAALVGYWPMDETEGTTANDTIGENHGIWQNGTTNNWIPDGMRGGAALLPNGDNNFFNVASIQGLNGAKAMTISVWINPNSDNGYNGIFMTRELNNGDGNSNGNWGIAQEGNNNPRHIDSRTQGAAVDSSDVIDHDGLPVDDGTNEYEGVGPDLGWYHVILVWDGDMGIQDIYINGIDNALGSSGQTEIATSGSWRIGDDACCNGREFSGAIDELAVWNEALSPEDIQALWEQTKIPSDINPPTDNDGDGLANDYEVLYPGFLDPEVADADEDVDRVGGVIGGEPMPDGLTNIEERDAFTDPRNPDSDFDGLLDGEEVKTYFTDPNNFDTDGDTILDSEEVVEGVDGYITDPLKRDTDGDGFFDDVEILDRKTDPNDAADPAVGPMPEAGLVHLWRFDESDGGTAADVIGSVNGEWLNADFDGFVFNLLWVPGQIGGAADLEGNTDDSGNYFDLEALTGIVGPANLTISAWVSPDAQTDNAYAGVFMTRLEGEFLNENWGLAYEGNSNFDYRIPTNADGGSDGGNPDGRAAPGSGWHHVVITYDQALAERTHYLNAVPVQRYGNSYPFDLTGEGWKIGFDENQSNRDFDGKIDDLSVWNRALTQDEVRSIFVNGEAGMGVGPEIVDPPVGGSFLITEFARNPDGTVTLTWNSDPAAGTKYTVLASADLTLPVDEWPDLNDNVETQGVETTFTSEVDAFPADAETYFFIVRKNP